MKNLNLLFKTMLVMLLPFTAFSQTWVKQTSGTSVKLRTVQFLDANNGYAGGNAGTVLKTTNGGSAWTNVSISTVTSAVMDLSFVDANTGWAAVGDTTGSGSGTGIWKTSNGGTTWTKQLSTTTPRICLSFVSSQTGWASGGDVPIKFNATTNGGASYMTQSSSTIYGWVYGIDAVDANTIYAVMPVYFTSSGLVVKSSNGGSTWSAVQGNGGSGSGSPGNNIPYLYAVDFVDASTGYAVGKSGSIHATTNGGTTWTTQTSNTSVILDGVSFYTTTNGFVCGRNGVILSTTNGGTAWATETSGVTSNLNDINAVSTDAWAVGDAGTILHFTILTGTTESQELDDKVHVYPNPFSNSTVISFDNPSVNEPFSLVIYDVTGKEVKRMENISSSEIIVSRKNLPAGMYTYNLLNKEKSAVATGKLIIN